MPEATAAAAPPELPPGVRSVFHGLRVTPVRRHSVADTEPNSGVVVLPISTNPARRSRSTTSSSNVAGSSVTPSDPWPVTHPATS